MNLFIKLRRLAVLRSLLTLLALLGASIGTADPAKPEIKAKVGRKSPAKSARKPIIGAVSPSAISVRLTWQTIRSQGTGSKLSTSAETFSQVGEIVPVGLDVWKLRVAGFDIPVSMSLGLRGKDSVMFIERQDLLRTFGIVLKPSWVAADLEKKSLSGIGLVLSPNQNRYLETIYRAPDEDLFMVKANAMVLRSRL